jgi:hypothetical protein
MIDEYGEFGGMKIGNWKIGRGKLKYWEQTNPVASKQIIVKREKYTVHLYRYIYVR